MPILAAGTLSAVSNLLYRSDSFRRATVTISDAGSGGTANLHVKGAGSAKVRRIGKSTVVSSASRIEVPGDGTFIALGPGDEIYGDAATGTLDFVISGE